MLAILIPMVRLTLEVLGSEVLRGSVGDTLKLLTSQHYQSIMSAQAGYSASEYTPSLEGFLNDPPPWLHCFFNECYAKEVFNNLSTNSNLHQI